MIDLDALPDWRFDRRGVPIFPGDLLKTDHFVDRRGKRHYLYHTVVSTPDGLDIVPTDHLEASKVSGGGRCRLQAADPGTQSVVIAGHGPGDLLSFEDRPRRKRVAAEGAG